MINLLAGSVIAGAFPDDLSAVHNLLRHDGAEQLIAELAGGEQGLPGFFAHGPKAFEEHGRPAGEKNDPVAINEKAIGISSEKCAHIIEVFFITTTPTMRPPGSRTGWLA